MRENRVQEIKKLEDAIELLQGLDAPVQKSIGRRTSPATIRKIREAQLKRWAAIKQKTPAKKS